MTRRVVVIGGGASGTAAAYAAALGGARVTLIGTRPGATSLASGALDLGAPSPPLVDRSTLLAFLQALDLWKIGHNDCHVATRSGVVRPAGGCDRAVLDLSRAGRAVAIIDVPRGGWDAPGLARAYNLEPWAIERGLAFAPVPLAVLRHADESTIPDADLARRHDAEERIAWLADRLGEARSLRDMDGVLFGPWLGVRADVAHQLSAALGKEVGETLSRLDGVAGIRFHEAREQLLQRMAIKPVAGWVVRVHGDDEGPVRIELDSGAAHDADAVVLAVGGLVGQGISWSPSDAANWNDELGSRPGGFALSLDAPVLLGLFGHRLPDSGSPHGPLFESYAWSGGPGRTGIERIGVLTRPDGRVRRMNGDAEGWLWAAGDAVADAPRTMLQAISSGLLAGAAAASASKPAR